MFFSIPYSKPIASESYGRTIIDSIDKKFDNNPQKVSQALAGLFESLKTQSESKQNLVKACHNWIEKNVLSLRIAAKGKYGIAIKQGAKVDKEDRLRKAKYLQWIKALSDMRIPFRELDPSDHIRLESVRKEFESLLGDEVFLVPFVNHLMPNGSAEDKTKLIAFLTQMPLPDGDDLVYSILFKISYEPKAHAKNKKSNHEVKIDWQKNSIVLRDDALELTKIAISQEVSKLNLNDLTLFRTDNLVTKMFRVYSKRVGQKWLHDLLRPTFSVITDKQSRSEIDINECCTGIMKRFESTWPENKSRPLVANDEKDRGFHLDDAEELPRGIYDLLEHMRLEVENKRLQLLTTVATEIEIRTLNDKIQQLKWLPIMQLFLRVIGSYLAEPLNWGVTDPKDLSRQMGKLIAELNSRAVNGQFNLKGYDTTPNMEISPSQMPNPVNTQDQKTKYIMANEIRRRKKLSHRRSLSFGIGSPIAADSSIRQEQVMKECHLEDPGATKSVGEFTIVSSKKEEQAQPKAVSKEEFDGLKRASKEYFLSASKQLLPRVEKISGSKEPI